LLSIKNNKDACQGYHNNNRDAFRPYYSEFVAHPRSINFSAVFGLTYAGEPSVDLKIN